MTESRPVPAAGPNLGQLVSTRDTVDENTLTEQVAARFRSEPMLEALAVVDAQGRAVGLLDRTKLLMKLAHQYGHALYSRAPVSRLVGKHALIVDADAQLEPVLMRVLARPEADLYDSIVVAGTRGEPIGLVSVKQLILQQSTALANAALERQLLALRTRELEEISQVKSSFIAHVTHELRSPVNAIIGIVELLTRSSSEAEVAQVPELLAMLASSATSLRTLITNVLDLSKLESGHMQVLAERFDVVALVRDIAGVTRILIGNKPVSVEVLAHAGTVMLVSDPVKLKQILMNLVSNAAKFTEQGQVRLEIEANQAGVQIVVSDSGIGIADSQKAQIFEPFVQADHVHTRRHEGTGLGLTITLRLLSLLGGTLQLDSELGRGSTFRVQLPQLVQDPQS